MAYKHNIDMASKLACVRLSAQVNKIHEPGSGGHIDPGGLRGPSHERPDSEGNMHC